MASMMVQIKVKDFNAWQDVFNAGNALRADNGEISHQIFRDESDPNSVIAIYRWNSLANAQTFARSPELRSSMEKAGVMGPPQVTFLSEV